MVTPTSASDVEDIAQSVGKANALRSSLPGLTRQSIRFERSFAKKMYPRIKPGATPEGAVRPAHDAEI
jgi:hypothetical protein